MRIKTLVALYFWILEFDDVTCIRSIAVTLLSKNEHRIDYRNGNKNGNYKKMGVIIVKKKIVI